ncbi:MAG: signal peptidase II [Chloroflexota bacterium]
MTTVQQQQSAGWLTNQLTWLRDLPKARIGYQTILWGVAVVTIMLDQATKWWIETNMALYDVIYPVAFMSDIFNFFHVKNPGAAFGMGQAYGWFFTTVAFLVTGGILFYNTVILKQYTTFRISLGLILGGALGNVIDRLRIGEVTDFINFDFRPWVSEAVAETIPLVNFAVFNLADLWIFSGVCIMFWLMWKDTLPEDPWTEAEEIPQFAPAEDAPIPDSLVDATPAAALVHEPPQTHFQWRGGPSSETNWRQLESDEPETETNARFGLRTVIFFGIAILLITFVVVRRRRKK